MEIYLDQHIEVSSKESGSQPLPIKATSIQTSGKNSCRTLFSNMGRKKKICPRLMKIVSISGASSHYIKFSKLP
jgi:hypothetical protein